MPGGGIPCPFKAAKPVEPGWGEAAWYRAFNAANSRIRSAEGAAAETAARQSGRTRKEARLLRTSYSDTTGKKRKRGATGPEPRSSAPVLSAGESPVEATSSREPPADLNIAQALGAMAITLPFTYPLTPAQANQVVTIHGEEKAQINKDLDFVRTTCEEKCHSNTKRCVEHSKEVRSLWRKYYTVVRSGSWVSYRSTDYVAEMKRLFDSKSDIQQIHARAAKEMRMHYKDVLCTIRLNDDPAVKKYKQEAAAMYDANKPESVIREFIRQKELEVKEERSPKQSEYDFRLASCKNEEEKRAIYQEDACTPLNSDTQAMLKLRLRWLEHFESGLPYPDIFTIMQKDISDYHKMKRELTEKLDGLQRAKAAHDKAKIAKEVKRAVKDTTARIQMLSKYTFYCANEHCQNLSVPLSQDEGNLECTHCYRMVDSGVDRARSYFCSEECMDRDGRTHILLEHPCNAAAGCTTGVFYRSIREPYYGFCTDCWKYFEVINYFCSKECYHKNWADHCKYVHVPLRAALVEKIENDKAFFDEWKVKMKLTDEEIEEVLPGMSWANESHGLPIRTSDSPN